MAKTSSLWSGGLLCIFLMTAGIFQISAIHHNGLNCNQRSGDGFPYFLSTEITNIEFTESLLDPNSADYYNLKSEIDGVFIQAYNLSNSGLRYHYLGTRDMSFSKGHQIKVETILLFLPTQINKSTVKYTFSDYIKDSQDTILTFNTTNVSCNPFPTTTTKSPSTLQTYTTTAVSTSESSPTVSPLPSPTSSQGPGTNGTTTTATTSHTTPLQNHTTDSTPNASRTPVTNNQDSTATNAPVTPLTVFPGPTASTPSVVPTTTHPVSTEHSTGHSTAASASRAVKPTINHQKVSNSTGTTAYPLVPYWLDWVPGWGIALLVLASLILLLLIILIILLLLRWCCMDEPQAAPSNDPYSPHSPYSSHSPAKTPIINKAADFPRTPEKPKGNRTGMYVVNP